MKLNVAVVPIAAVVILFPLGYSVARSVFSHAAEPAEAFLEMPDAKYKECVRDVTYMRFHHMTLLKELRDDAVRKGVRGEIGLGTCRQCHPSREGFCNQCHNAVNLRLDCFGCHYYP